MYVVENSLGFPVHESVSLDSCKLYVRKHPDDELFIVGEHDESE